MTWQSNREAFFTGTPQYFGLAGEGLNEIREIMFHTIRAGKGELPSFLAAMAAAVAAVPRYLCARSTGVCTESGLSWCCEINNCDRRIMC